MREDTNILRPIINFETPSNKILKPPLVVVDLSNLY